MNIYVGNLSYNVDEDTLTSVFEEFGEVVSAKIIKDKFTGSSKGFAFVEMAEESDAEKAIEELDGKAIEGRNVKVNKAHPQERRNNNSRPPRGPRRY